MEILNSTIAILKNLKISHSVIIHNGVLFVLFTLPRFSTGTVSSTAPESPGSVGEQNTQGSEG